MSNFFDMVKKVGGIFYVRWAVTLFIAVCVGFGIVGPILHSFDNQAVETSAAKKKLPIYCVGTDEKKVAISFDAAWGAEDTDSLLKVLKDNDVKATFFLCGYWVDKYPEEVKRIYEAGHTIGNHSNTHPHGNQLSLQKNKEEIMAVHQKVKDLLGIEMNLYRPPFGEYNDTVLTAAEECSYYPIQWDVDVSVIK
jgi:peptidoglycan/xylan/chitin deacetylase (PgdA/CDA1 family)